MVTLSIGSRVHLRPDIRTVSNVFLEHMWEYPPVLVSFSGEKWQKYTLQ